MKNKKDKDAAVWQRIATQLKVSYRQVREVAYGRVESPRIHAALIAEFRRMYPEIDIAVEGEKCERFCVRCRKPMLDRRGDPNFKRFYCSESCRKKSDRAQLKLTIARDKERGRCSECNHRFPKKGSRA